MANPFEKRATEYLRDDEAFLAVVTPEPLHTFFHKPAQDERLYDRLTMIIGTPGSGKTTLARLFQFSTLRTLLLNSSIVNYKPLIDMLTACGAVDDEHPTLVGGRLPLEAEYREFWEFPYPIEIRTRLMITLLQARSVLAWLRNIEATGVSLEKVTIIPRSDANAALLAIGGRAGPELREQARKVESAIYRISAALIPPDITEIDQNAIAAYRPFDVIESVHVSSGEEELELRPLIIFDDAHRLHPDQFKKLKLWLVRRELRVARWVLTRLDVLSPRDVLMGSRAPTGGSGLNHSREVTLIRMQGGVNRRRERLAFRKMAKDMAGRYLRQVEVFNRRSLRSFGALLSTEPETIAAGKRKRLAENVDSLQGRYGISANRRLNLERIVEGYLADQAQNSEDVRLAILAVLLERYARRVPQRHLFGEMVDDLDPRTPLKADAGVADGARIHLLHKFERPYYFGIDTLCDASSENAEQFLRLASRLVSQLETQIIRGKQAMLTSKDQHQLLRQRAKEMVDEWDFPHFQLVRRLADGIATECLQKSLEANAPLRGGATAFGILQSEFETIPENHPNLARVLQFGVAYNAFVLVPEHKTKGRLWCLIELGGVLRLMHGLTLKRGGFLERHAGDLLRLLTEH